MVVVRVVIGQYCIDDMVCGGDIGCPWYCRLCVPVFIQPNKTPAIQDGDMQIEAVLPNGKHVGHRSMGVYFKQNLNGLSNTNHLAITSGVDKAKMSLINCGRYRQVATTTVTPLEKKHKTLEARNVQLRASRFSNFQMHFRAQILM